MNTRWILTLAALFALPAAAAASGEKLDTDVALLIASSEDRAAGSGVPAPGSVIPLSPPGQLMPGAPPGAALGARMLTVAETLQQTLQLAEVKVRYSLSLPLAVDAARDLPPPSFESKTAPRLTLLGFDDRSVSYRVQVTGGETPVVDTEIVVDRDRPAVVCVAGGESAHHFLVVGLAPRSAPPDRAAGPMQVQQDVTPPRFVWRPPPSYTDEARKAGIEGVVIVQAIILADGTVGDVKVLKGLGKGLSEAAVEAVREWRFEPAFHEGRPVPVYYNLMVNFRLKKRKS